eukprot:GHUV01005320.1.p1 GENE.GHUV01005320.1~~GHUV01005320.1.p1  ORF type:complete len:325 (+),score=87.88 GHUV01005320.1:753-1727(+)
MVVESVIPLVDISQDEATAAKQVCRACTEQGFMYVTGHGIPSEQVDAVFAQLKAAFAMPLEAKQAMIADENNRGWTPFAEETLDPERQSKGDTKEGFYFGREVSPDSPEGKLPLHGPNQWPPEDLLPGFRQTITDYFQALTNLGMRMLRLLALSLGLPAEYFDEYFTSPMVALRPLHYSAEVSAPNAGVFAAGAHSDYGMLTFLKTDDVPGLQVFLNHRWHDVAPVPGAFIVNLGDMLERWTNGLFKSTLHRVVNTSGRERYSMAFFFEPNFNTRVECLPCCVSDDTPAAYEPTTAGEHLLAKYAQTHAGYDVNQKQQRQQRQQ